MCIKIFRTETLVRQKEWVLCLTSRNQPTRCANNTFTVNRSSSPLNSANTPVNNLFVVLIVSVILHLVSARTPIFPGGFRLTFGRVESCLRQQVTDMVKAQSLRIIILTFAVAGSHAWTNSAVGRAPNPNSALQYRNGDDYQPVQSSIINVISDELDANLRLQIALQAARDADRLYGLCTPASTRAWKMVDEIYSLTLASNEVENNVKRVLGEEKSIWRVFQQ